ELVRLLLDLVDCCVRCFRWYSMLTTRRALDRAAPVALEPRVKMDALQTHKYKAMVGAGGAAVQETSSCHIFDGDVHDIEVFSSTFYLRQAAKHTNRAMGRHR
ncbi:MAG: hypothetical protein AAF391_11180, partial [Bacteroidota bacterium]